MGWSHGVRVDIKPRMAQLAYIALVVFYMSMMYSVSGLGHVAQGRPLVCVSSLLLLFPNLPYACPDGASINIELIGDIYKRQKRRKRCLRKWVTLHRSPKRVRPRFFVNGAWLGDRLG